MKTFQILGIWFTGLVAGVAACILHGHYILAGIIGGMTGLLASHIGRVNEP